MLERDARSDGLDSLLGAIRQRLAARSALAALAFAVLCGALAMLAGRVLWTAGYATQMPPMAAFGLGAMIVALCFGFAFVRFPGQVEIARRAEQQTGGAERLTTALEMRADRAAADTLVGRALADDADRHAQTIDARSIAPVLPTTTLAAIGVAALAGGLWFAVPAPGTTAPAPVPETVIAEVSEVPAESSGDATIEDISLMANLVNDIGVTRDEDVLTRVANELYSLASDAGRTMTQAELNAEFQRLISESVVGFGNDMPAWMPTAGTTIADVSQSLADFRIRVAEQIRLNDEYAAQNLEIIKRVIAEAEAAGEPSMFLSGDGPEGKPYEGPAGEMGSPDMSLEDLVAMDMASASGGQAPSLRPEEEMTEGAATGAAMPAGASQQSTAGEADAAGLGTQDLADDDGFLRVPRAQGNEMVLTAAEVDKGRRIRITVAPEMPEGDSSEPEVAAASSGFAGRAGNSDHLLWRDQVAFPEREAVARYFSPWNVDSETAE